MTKLLLKLIRFYQLAPLGFARGNCRYSPTCSEYSYQAIAKYGIFKGSLLGIKRVFKCHPYFKGDPDNVV